MRMEETTTPTVKSLGLAPPKQRALLKEKAAWADTTDGSLLSSVEILRGKSQPWSRGCSAVLYICVWVYD